MLNKVNERLPHAGYSIYHIITGAEFQQNLIYFTEKDVL